MEEPPAGIECGGLGIFNPCRFNWLTDVTVSTLVEPTLTQPRTDLTFGVSHSSVRDRDSVTRHDGDLARYLPREMSIWR